MARRISSGKVWILTATDGFLGELVGAPVGDGSDAVYTIRNVSWVAETGRRGAFVRTGLTEATEVEWYGEDSEADIPASSVIHVCRWKHALPQKDQ